MFDAPLESARGQRSPHFRWFGYRQTDRSADRQKDRRTYCSTETVSWSKVEATLLIHGVLKPRQLRQSRPIMVEWVVTKTVISTEERERQTDKLRFLVDIWCVQVTPDVEKIFTLEFSVSVDDRKYTSSIVCSTHCRYLCSSLQLHRDQWYRWKVA